MLPTNTEEETAANAEVSPFYANNANRKRRPFATAFGWWVGILLGIFGGLLLLPKTRPLLKSQGEAAITSNRTSLTAPLRLTPSDFQVFDKLARSEPSDLLLQIGTVAAQVDQPLSNDEPYPTEWEARHLLKLLHHYPSSPALHALLVRTLLKENLITSLKGGSPSRVPTPAANANNLLYVSTAHGQLLKQTLEAGERLEPQNAFWPALLSYLYFANHQDKLGEHFLEQVQRTSMWNSHLYEQLEGEWLLYAKVYGDQGALQELEPLTLLSFPHLQALRAMAFHVVALSERLLQKENVAEAFRLHHALACLGAIMRDTAPWAYEALFGTELVLLASSEGMPSVLRESLIVSEQRRENATSSYFAILRKEGGDNEVGWLAKEVQKSLQVRKAIGLARSAAPYDGVPPGIPLKPLLTAWMMGVFTLQQMVGLGMAWAGVSLLAFCERRLPRWGKILLMGLFMGTLGSYASFFWMLPSPGGALALLCSLTILVLLMLELIGSQVGKGSSYQPPLGCREFALLAGLSAAATALLWVLGYQQFHSLHPEAQLLKGLDSVLPRQGAWPQLKHLLFGTSMAVLLVVLGGGTGLLKGRDPLKTSRALLNRTVLPLLALMAICYLVTVQATLQQDARTSAAIHEAVHNDREWVLTHTLSE